MLERDSETLAYSLNGQRLFLRGVWYPFANIFSAAPSARSTGATSRCCGTATATTSSRSRSSRRTRSTTRATGSACSCSRSCRTTSSGRCACSTRPIRASRSTGTGRSARSRTSSSSCAATHRWCCGPRFAETRKQERWVWGDYTDYSAAIEEIVAAPRSRRDLSPELLRLQGGAHLERRLPVRRVLGPPRPQPPLHLASSERSRRRSSRRCGSSCRPRRSGASPEGLEGRLALPLDAEEYSYRWAFDYAGMCTSVARMFSTPTGRRAHARALRRRDPVVPGASACATAPRSTGASASPTSPAAVPGRTARTCPGIKFTVVDHRQRPKLGYFGLQQAYEPLLLSVDDREPLRPRGAGSRVPARPLARQRHAAGGEARRSRSGCSTRAAASAAPGPAGGDGRGRQRAGAGELDLELPARPGRTWCARRHGDADGSPATVAARAGCRSCDRVRASRARPRARSGALQRADPGCASRDVCGHRADVVDEESRVPQDSSLERGARRARRCRLVRGLGLRRAPVPRARMGQHRRGGCTRASDSCIRAGRRRSTGATVAERCSTPRRSERSCPSACRPHDGVWDRIPVVRRVPDRSPLFAAALDGMPFRGFSRTTARPDAETHWTIGTLSAARDRRLWRGQDGRLHRVVHEAAADVPHRRGPRLGDPLDVEPHWARRDIRAYGPDWRGLLEFALGQLAHATGRSLAAAPEVLADEIRTPLFERLTRLSETALEAVVTGVDAAPGGGTTGTLRVTNTGATVARLVRGVVLAGDERDHRFRDGFVDLMPARRRRCASRRAAPPRRSRLSRSGRRMRRRDARGFPSPRSRGPARRDGAAGRRALDGDAREMPAADVCDDQARRALVRRERDVRRRREHAARGSRARAPRRAREPARTTSTASGR